MQNIYLKITLPMMLALTLMITADEIAQAEIAAIGRHVPVKTKCSPPKPKLYEYHNRIVIFDPLHQAYERIKPDAFYAGIELWATYALANGGSHVDQLIGEAELRMGYNYFFNGRDHVTPFVGVGVFKDFRVEHVNHVTYRIGSVVFHDHDNIIKPAVVYGVFGLLYDHEFNSFFTLGANFKGMVGGAASKKKHFKWGNPVGGIDVALPITFRFGPKRHWDIRLEPFDIFMHGTHISRNYFGSRCTVGYRF
jgi:hypothetical protein